MGWTILGFLIILGIGVPILNIVYQTFVNPTNGTWQNWTVNGTAPYSTFELGIFQFIPLLAALMAVIFILMLLAGRFKKEPGQM